MGLSVDFIPTGDEFDSIANQLCATNLARCLDDAEDLIQDATLKLMEQPERAASTVNHRKLFLTIVQNLALDRIRFRRRHPELSLASIDACVASPADGELRRRLREFHSYLQQKIATLPKEQRDVFALYFVGGAAVEDIAAISARQTVSVYELLGKARSKIREALEEHPEWCEFAPMLDERWSSPHRGSTNLRRNA